MAADFINMIEKYFSDMDIPMPEVTAISVGDGSNNHGVDLDADGEVFLDIAVAGSVAPKAKIVVYFAKMPTTNDVIDAILQAIHQSEKDSANNPTVIPISWGSPEDRVPGSLIKDIGIAFKSAAAMGKTILVASGDWGVADTTPVFDSNLHCDFPSTDPFSLVCGGTELQALNGNITQEVAWNEHNGWASGVGISKIVNRPNYQMDTNIPISADGSAFQGRAIPDVSGNASSNSGYLMLQPDGKYYTVGGTSAVAPLWAGLIACINQALPQPMGFINSLLYKRIGPLNILRDITDGDNNIRDNEFGNINGYSAGGGWDACTG